MGFLINERELINNNLFNHEARMSSSISRFLDKTPTYVTYYNISNIASTGDTGFENVEELVGSNSPIRFNKVANFPIYGIENIALELEDNEEGLTTNFDGSGIILPNTIKPIPGDFFTIQTIGNDVTFIVTDIAYDTIKSNNFYNISYSLKTIGDNASDKLDMQISDKFECVVDNIGTEDKCIIKEDVFNIIKSIEINVADIIETYKAYFYSDKYNAFIVPENGVHIFDKYLSNFIVSNGLCNEKGYMTIIPNTEMNEKLDTIMYSKSIYRSLENRKLLPNKYYAIRSMTDKLDSLFAYYGADVSSIEIGFGSTSYISESLYSDIKNNNIRPNIDSITSTIIQFFNDDGMNIYDINNKVGDIEIELTIEHMQRIPMLLYIINFIYKQTLKNI